MSKRFSEGNRKAAPKCRDRVDKLLPDPDGEFLTWPLDRLLSAIAKSVIVFSMSLPRP